MNNDLLDIFANPDPDEDEQPIEQEGDPAYDNPDIIDILFYADRFLAALEDIVRSRTASEGREQHGSGPSQGVG